MRIIRFVDKHGETHFGEDLGKGRAQPLDGDLYEGTRIPGFDTPGEGSARDVSVLWARASPL